MTAMALPLTFDALNQLTGYKRSISISRYFDEMKLTRQQKAYRKALARKLEDEMVWLMSYLFYARQQGIGVSMDALSEIRQRYRVVLLDIQREYPSAFAGIQQEMNFLAASIVAQSNEIARARMAQSILDTPTSDSGYIATHIDSATADIIDATNRHKDDPYFYSKDRARLIAESESNSIWNYTEYASAVKNKKYKTWHTIMDGHQRDSHGNVNGMTIPINERFVLDAGTCLFPRSDELPEEEVCGCRCSLSFS